MNGGYIDLLIEATTSKSYDVIDTLICGQMFINSEGAIVGDTVFNHFPNFAK